MSIAIDVGSDLYGTKNNVQLKFNALPTLAELAAATESAFDTKARAQRPAGYPDHPFRIETFQVFDDALMRWVDLYDARQLKHGSQLWCFQPESIWHSDAQGVIPESEKTVATFTTPLGSPRRARIASDAGVPPTLSEKLRSVFYQVDGSNKGYLLFQDLERAFRACDMEFTHATAGELFTLADSNRSSHITYDEWVNFAIKAPSIIDALFFRMRDMYQDRLPVGQSPPGFDAQRARQEELQRMYQASFADQQARQRQEQEFAAARAREEQRMHEQRAAEQRMAEQRAAEQRMAEQRMAEQRAAEERQRMASAAAAAAQQQQAQAQAAAQQAAQQQAAADAAAQQAAQQHAAAQHAAQQAAQQHAAAQQAAQQAAAQQAEAERYASASRVTATASATASYHSPPPAHGTSPQREQALRDYEMARRKADELRMAKEEAEREERNAWDRCYYAPASPHYGPGNRGY